MRRMLSRAVDPMIGGVGPAPRLGQGGRAGGGAGCGGRDARDVREERLGRSGTVAELTPSYAIGQKASDWR